jgi:hypothetical protein
MTVPHRISYNWQVVKRPTDKPVKPDQYGNRKARRAWLKQERIANMSRKSVRTVSGGLPSLGKKT